MKNRTVKFGDSWLLLAYDDKTKLISVVSGNLGRICCDVAGGIGGSVGGGIAGSVDGTIDGDVWGNIESSIFGHVFGNVEGNAGGVKGNIGEFGGKVVGWELIKKQTKDNKEII